MYRIAYEKIVILLINRLKKYAGNHIIKGDQLGFVVFRGGGSNDFPNINPPPRKQPFLAVHV